MNEQMTLRIVLFQGLNNEYGVPPKAIEFGLLTMEERG